MSTVVLHKNGVEVFPAMFRSIDHAVSCVALEMYIFNDDRTGREFRSRLVAAALRNVEVKVLIDAFGSWSLPDVFWEELRQAGGEVRWFRPIRRGMLPFRDHRKLLLVDDSIAFIGGLNIGDEYLYGTGGEPPWRDNALEIRGVEVTRLRRSFARMWSRADRPLRFRFFLTRREHREHLIGMVGGGKIRILESGPEDPVQPVRRAYGRLIRRSRVSIDLSMSYFFPPGPVLRALKRAVRRGVRVRLLFPARSDVMIAQLAARGLYGRLLRAGMKVWEYQPAMLHAKLAVIDDTVITGSANLDVRSGRINYELVAAATDPALAARARADFEDDLRSSLPVVHAVWQQRPLFQRVTERISYWLLARADLFSARTRLARMKW
jgi:cardiolipin synthase